MRLSGFIITQVPSIPNTIEADDEIENLAPTAFTQKRQKEALKDLSGLEKSTFTSSNSCLGWLGKKISAFCSAAASRFQQCLLNPHVSDSTKRKTSIQELQNW